MRGVHLRVVRAADCVVWRVMAAFITRQQHNNIPHVDRFSSVLRRLGPAVPSTAKPKVTASARAAAPCQSFRSAPPEWDALNCVWIASSPSPLLVQGSHVILYRCHEAVV